MALSPWLILALAVLVIGSLLLFIWRRRRQANAAAACPRCKTVFDPDTWKVRNVRKHYQGRYTITPAYLCPQCGYKMTPADLIAQELKER